MPENILRQLPAIDLLLRDARLQGLIATAGRETVRDRLRSVLGELRQEISNANGAVESLPDAQQLLAEIEKRLHAKLASRRQTRTQALVNATGVVLHTNLGRAPLSQAARAAINEAARDYCNLEYDLTTGQRGGRGAGLAAMLSDLLGCEAALVVNNCAAAVLLTLNTLAEGGEVLISRGELIEIGGSFRIPDVIAKSGARLREVGTTNRTRLRDYEEAINEHTKIILRAHPSNYRIVGFTEKPALTDLAHLAGAHHLPLFEDLGSGCLLDLEPLGIRDEPTIKDSLIAGASVVAFSGDKLFGGPQAGIILGEADLLARIRRNPLMRALRVDKLTLAALEATVAAYQTGRAHIELPALAALHTTQEAITGRAQNFLQMARHLSATLQLGLRDDYSVVGGGAAPAAQLPTTLITVTSTHLSAAAMEERLRKHAPPIIARIINDQLVLDLRTVTPDGERELLAALTALAAL